MKHLLSFIVILILLSLAKNSYSQEDRWKFVCDDEKSIYKYYIDSKTWIIKKDKANFWIKIIPQSNAIDTIAYEIAKWEIYFNERRLCEIEYTTYYNSGDFKIGKLNDCYEIIPDSIGEAFYDYLKGKRPLN